HRLERPFLCFGRVRFSGNDSRCYFVSGEASILRTGRATDGFQTDSLTRRVAAHIHCHVYSFLRAESLFLYLSPYLDGTRPRKVRALESLSDHFSAQCAAGFSLHATRGETRSVPSADFYRLAHRDSRLCALSRRRSV